MDLGSIYNGLEQNFGAMAFIQHSAANEQLALLFNGIDFDVYMLGLRKAMG